MAQRNPWEEDWSKPQSGVVISDPYRAAEEARKQDEERRRNQDQQFEAQRLAIAQQQAALATQAAGISAGKDAREANALDARGGVDTTESERTAAFLATRLAGGISDLQRIGMGRSPTLFEATAGQSKLGNYATAEEWQRASAAQRDILDAALTLGTGAAYTTEQLEGYRSSYFPQPGDQPGTIADKKIRLQRALEAARIKAGAAAPQIDHALAASGFFEPAGALSPEQQQQYDAVMAANPNATPDQLRAALAAAGLPTVANIDAIATARDAGSGVRPGSDAQPAPNGSYQESMMGQGMSGVNDGMANTLGLPVDLMTGAMNLIPRGLNAVANTDLPTINDPFMGSDWWKGQMGDVGATYAPNADGSNQFVRRVGESLGSAIAPVGATANTGRQAFTGLVSALGGGVGAATAQKAFPGNPLAEMGGELLGGALGGVPGMVSARNAAQRRIESAIPTVPQLKDQASDLYRAAEANGTVADPTLTQQLSDDLRGVLRQEGHVSPTGRISEVYPKSREAMQLVDDYAGQPMTPTQLQTVRGIVADGMKSQDGSERRIAGMMTDTFDNWAAPLAPELPQARDIASRYLNAQQLEQARELAGARAGQFTGSGFENALRTEYRGLDRNAIKGRARYGEELRSAIEDVSRGTPMSNIARGLGKMAPTGVVSGLIAPGATFGVGNAIGGPAVGAALSAGQTGLGIAGREAATRMGIRNADIAELTARNGGAIDQAPMIDPETARIIAGIMANQQAQELSQGGVNAQPGNEQGAYQQPNPFTGGVGRPAPKSRGLFGRPY